MPVAGLGSQCVDGVLAAQPVELHRVGGKHPLTATGFPSGLTVTYSAWSGACSTGAVRHVRRAPPSGSSIRAFEADVRQVAIHRVGLCGRNRDRNLLFLGVVDQVGTRLEYRAISGCNDLDVRIQCVCGEFEADLVVALAVAPWQIYSAFSSLISTSLFAIKGRAIGCQANTCFRNRGGTSGDAVLGENLGQSSMYA